MMPLGFERGEISTLTVDLDGRSNFGWAVFWIFFRSHRRRRAMGARVYWGDYRHAAVGAAGEIRCPAGGGRVPALQFMVQGAWGIVLGIYFAILSPNAIRGFLPGFAYQCGNLLASYIAVLEAGLAAIYGYRATLTGSAIVIFIVAAVVTMLGREKKGIVFAGSTA